MFGSTNAQKGQLCLLAPETQLQLSLEGENPRQDAEEPMNDISSIQAGKAQELENKQASLEMRKLRQEHSQIYEKTVKDNEAELRRMKDEYQAKIGMMQSELEQKLSQFRDKQNDVMSVEKERLQTELEDLRKAHGDQVVQLKESQKNQIDRMVESHNKTIDNARQKFEKEKMKWNA